jgi:hypothetical protein
MRREFLKYPAVYRTQADMKGVTPLGMLGMLLSMVVLAVIYAMLYRARPVRWQTYAAVVR